MSLQQTLQLLVRLQISKDETPTEIDRIIVPTCNTPYLCIPVSRRRKMEAFLYDYEYLKGKGQAYVFNKSNHVICDYIRRL